MAFVYILQNYNNLFENYKSDFFLYRRQSFFDTNYCKIIFGFQIAFLKYIKLYNSCSSRILISRKNLYELNKSTQSLPQKFKLNVVICA